VYFEDLEILIVVDPHLLYLVTDSLLVLLHATNLLLQRRHSFCLHLCVVQLLLQLTDFCFQFNDQRSLLFRICFLCVWFCLWLLLSPFIPVDIVHKKRYVYRIEVKRLIGGNRWIIVAGRVARARRDILRWHILLTRLYVDLKSNRKLKCALIDTQLRCYLCFEKILQLDFGAEEGLFELTADLPDQV